MIENVGTTSLDSFKVEARKLLQNAINQNQSNDKTINGAQDKVTLGSQPINTGTYAANVGNSAETLLSNAYTQLRDMFANTLHEQGIATTIATDNGEINLETLTPDDAQTLISDDGYFGVDNTAQRIFDFATGLAGDDPSRLEAIMDGIKDGFSQAEQAWGGALPDISYATRDALQGLL